MSYDSQSPLSISVRKSLILRLVIGGSIICVILAVYVFLANRNTVGGVVAYRMIQMTQLFNAMAAEHLNTEGPLDPSGLQNSLKELAARPHLKMQQGKFVYAGIYDLSGRQITKLTVPDYELIDPVSSFMENTSHGLTFENGSWHKTIRIQGKLLVRAAVILTNNKGEGVAHVEGIYALSPAVISEIRIRMIKGILIGISVVIATVLLMYPIILNLLSRVSRLTVNLLDSNLETLQVLGSAIAKRDSDTDAHNYRVTIFSVRLAEAAGLDRQAIQKLIKGAFLHDVGKIGVRDNVLLKPGKLDDEEFEVMKTHVRHGLDIVSRSNWLHDAEDIVGCHHEKYSGKGGYGSGFAGDEIPINARIFAIADVFDALTSKRPYKEPFTFDKSIEILKEGRGTHFDPVLVDMFISIAQPLYDLLSGKDDTVPREELGGIIEEYFTKISATY
jgi:HD-GYP domain-containing protein (c-di-GMP phosphodiesterase class II)